jgi:hypothetical protein
MPRVNRDLQRRLAARRERERRRPPAERRYRFSPAETVETPAEPEDELFDGAPEMLPAEETAAPPRPRRRAEAAAKSAPPAPAGRTTQRANYKPFSAYAAEYAYVGRDLRRIAAVVGSLLVVLIVLHFVLPR